MLQIGGQKHIFWVILPKENWPFGIKSHFVFMSNFHPLQLLSKQFHFTQFLHLLVFPLVFHYPLPVSLSTSAVPLLHLFCRSSSISPHFSPLPLPFLFLPSLPLFPHFVSLSTLCWVSCSLSLWDWQTSWRLSIDPPFFLLAFSLSCSLSFCLTHKYTHTLGWQDKRVCYAPRQSQLNKRPEALSV